MKIIALALASTALMAAPALAQNASSTMPTQPATAASAPAAPNVAVGASVSDTSGASVGTIDSVGGGNAVVSTGTAKAAIPVSAFAQGEKGLVIAMTKADLEAAVTKATKPTTIAVGAPVSDTKGGKVGTVAAVSGDLVTVQTASTKAQLPKTAFAQSGGTLVIAMTATELDAAAKAAAKSSS